MVRATTTAHAIIDPTGIGTIGTIITANPDGRRKTAARAAVPLLRLTTAFISINVEI
jgi:hypothetical protein